MRRAEAVLHARTLAVDPRLRFPVAPFEEERNALAGPCLGYFDVALIPRRAHVFVERTEDVDARLRGRAADALLVQRTRQPHRAGERGVLPLAHDALALGVELEPPLARQGEYRCGILRPSAAYTENAHGARNRTDHHVAPVSLLGAFWSMRNRYIKKRSDNKNR